MATLDFYGPYYLSSYNLGPLAPGASWDLHWLLDRPSWFDATHTVTASSITLEPRDTEILVRTSQLTRSGTARGRNDYILHAQFTNIGSKPIEFLFVFLSFVSK